MNKKVAIIGIKWIGKDFFYWKIKEYLDNNKKTSIRLWNGDMLKKKSLQNFDDWTYNNYLNSDFNYVKEINKKELIEKYKIKQIEHLLPKKYNKLTKNEKLEVIEITKNIPDYKTRVALQSFGDFLKRKKQNHSVFVEYLLKEMKKRKEQFIFNTDTRFISELIHFILNDFYIIKLWHDQIFKIENISFPHLSELELSLENNINLWLLIDVKWKSKDIKWIYRQNEEEVKSIINTTMEKIKKFKWYSKEDKEEIIKIKKESLQYDSILSKISSDYLNETDFKKKEKVKLEYIKEKRNILQKINNIIQKYYK